jgi:hypothetical protein
VAISVRVSKAMARVLLPSGWQGWMLCAVWAHARVKKVRIRSIGEVLVALVGRGWPGGGAWCRSGIVSVRVLLLVFGARCSWGVASVAVRLFDFCGARISVRVRFRFRGLDRRAMVS